VRLPVLSRLSRGVDISVVSSAASFFRRDAVQVHTPMLEASLLVRMVRRRGVWSILTHHGIW
jgi:hypothetical protein